MVSAAESIVVTIDMARGAKIIAHPVTSISTTSQKISSNSPFKSSVPIPKVKTKKGMKILVKIGHKTALTMEINMTNRNMSSKLLISKPKPKKLIR